MKITIHRGLEQIGGCITEISTDTSRVFIDMGQNLPGCGTHTTRDKDKAIVEALFAQNKKEHEAVFYTHGHEDHIGLMEFVPKKEDGVIQYVGEGTKELLKLKYKLIVKQQLMARDNGWPSYDAEKLKIAATKRKCLKKIDTWSRGGRPKSIQIGDIKITPFFNCHSIYDSYMFLIEADGERIWHTGDYRAHGYIGDKLFPVLKKYATNIDTLITEGTMLNKDVECQYETVISDRMAEVMKQRKYVFILASSTDIERLVSIKQATKAASRRLYVCSEIMDKMMKFFTLREGLWFKSKYHLSHKFFDVNNVEQYKKEGFVLVTGAGSIEKVRQYIKDFDQSQTILIYSSWDGYYTIEEQIDANPVYKEFREMFRNVVDIHTSGHADRSTIEKVIKTINAKEVIIIHKEKGAKL